MTRGEVSEVIHAAHALWNESGDPEPLFGRYWHEDFEWTEPPTSPNAGTFRGREAVVGYLRDWTASIGPSEHLIEELVVAGEEAMSAVRISVQDR